MCPDEDSNARWTLKPQAASLGQHTTTVQRCEPVSASFRTTGILNTHAVR
jgi:hypothetical protein